MSFVFRGSRADLESGFPGFIPEPPAVVCPHITGCMSAFFAYFFLPVSQLDYIFGFCYFELVTMLISLFSYQRIHTTRPVNTNSLAFLVTGNVFNYLFCSITLCFISAFINPYLYLFVQQLFCFS